MSRALTTVVAHGVLTNRSLESLTLRIALRNSRRLRILIPALEAVSEYGGMDISNSKQLRWMFDLKRIEVSIKWVRLLRGLLHSHSYAIISLEPISQSCNRDQITQDPTLSILIIFCPCNSSDFFVLSAGSRNLDKAEFEQANYVIILPKRPFSPAPITHCVSEPTNLWALTSGPRRKDDCAAAYTA
jgi:hypothetical protein